MQREGKSSHKSDQAALIVTYGNTTRKHCPLDRDLIVLGRTPACDVTLVSPEVSVIHCILLRGCDGWRIRDCCGGRHATRLNGRPIQEAVLRDSDVLQIGTFTFEVWLPASRTTPVPGNTPAVDERQALRLKRLQRSRRNLVRLAVRWRQRARKNQPLPPTLAELECQAESLRGLQRDYQALVQQYETRLSELEKAEREVCDAREQFERECAERQARLEKAEYELARRQVDPAPVAVHDVGSQEKARRLDRRSQELHCFARYLRRCRQHTQKQESKHSAAPPSRNGEAAYWREQCEQLQAEWIVLESRFQENHDALKCEYDRLRSEAERLALTVKQMREENHGGREHTTHEGSMPERLSRIHRIKKALAGTSPSAAGEQMRSERSITVDPAPRAADCTVAVDS